MLYNFIETYFTLSEKALKKGIEKGQILAKIESTEESIVSQQSELENLNAYFDTKQLPANLYKVMSSSVKKKIEK